MTNGPCPECRSGTIFLQILTRLSNLVLALRFNLNFTYLIFTRSANWTLFSFLRICIFLIGFGLMNWGIPRASMTISSSLTLRLLFSLLNNVFHPMGEMIGSSFRFLDATRGLRNRPILEWPLSLYINFNFWLLTPYFKTMNRLFHECVAPRIQKTQHRIQSLNFHRASSIALRITSFQEHIYFIQKSICFLKNITNIKLLKHLFIELSTLEEKKSNPCRNHLSSCPPLSLCESLTFKYKAHE